MRLVARLAWLVLLFIGVTASAQTAPVPQRPFGQLIDLWTRQLDRIQARIDQADILPVEIDSLRDQVTDVRAAAMAAAAIARNDLADTRKLLAPLEVKPGAETTPESDAVKAERDRLTDLATVSEGRVKQSEVVIARADQLLDRMTKLRGEVMLQTLLHRNKPPLSSEVWAKLPSELSASLQSLAAALSTWARNGLGPLGWGGQDLLPLAFWAVVTILLWWGGREMRHRYGRGESAEPGRRDRTIAAAIDGVGLHLVPILAVWLLGKLVLATAPPAPLDAIIGEIVPRLVVLLLVFGMTATALAPNRPAWRVLPFTDASARQLFNSVRRLMLAGITADIVYLALIKGTPNHEALSAIGALVLATIVALLTLPALGNRAWQAARPEGSELPSLIGGTWWSIVRLIVSVVVLSAIGFALAGFATLAAHLHFAISATCLLIAVALLLHRIVADLLETAAAPDTPTGRWVRQRLGLQPDSSLRGQQLLLLFFDFFLVMLLAVAIPTAWNVDIDAILQGFGTLLRGVRVGGVTISLGNIGMAMVAFGVCMLIARLVRSIVRDRVLPTVEAPLPLRQSIDAGLNYAGVMVAILVGIGALGVDFTNLAIVLGALSVGIGLGLQNIANNVISGVILLVERPIKAGDWIVVSGHEGFVRRINIRATEIETFQRTHVIVPNSVFLQNPVVNRTYSDTSSRIELKLTVGLGTDVGAMEALLREVALGHARVLRVPAPIVRFVRVAPGGLDFELLVFVARLEDRLVVTNDLNRAILVRLIEEKIVDPKPVAEFRLHDIDKLGAVLHGESTADLAKIGQPPGSDDADAPKS